MKAARNHYLIAAVAGLLLLSTNAAAQTQPASETFLEAIEEGRSNDVIDMVNKNGRAIVNVRGFSGVTPLTAAMRKRATMYVNFLLQNGADPNLAERTGDTPLIIAARLGHLEGVTAMLAFKAAVDATNRQGETALIIAVQNRNAPIVRRLLEAGASPSRTDNASGLSARDYAARDRRSVEILKLIESTKKKPVFVAGPIIQ